MGVVQDAVEDSVGDGGIAEVLVPLGVRELAGDDGRPVRVAIFDDLEEVVTVSLQRGVRAQSSMTRTSMRASRARRRA